MLWFDNNIRSIALSLHRQLQSSVHLQTMYNRMQESMPHLQFLPGLPALPSGIEETISSLCSVVSLSQFLCVAIVPGAIALHLIPYLPNSAAMCFVIPRVAALATGIWRTFYISAYCRSRRNVNYNSTLFFNHGRKHLTGSIYKFQWYLHLRHFPNLGPVFVQSLFPTAHL